MVNRTLTEEERKKANTILQEVRERMQEVAGDDAALFWALRRKVYKELVYDERGKPSKRQRLKKAKRKEQGGLCVGPDCGQELPERGAVLDRLEAMAGYTAENTRLLCPPCDARLQVTQDFT